MKSEKLQIKFFARPNAAFELETVVPVFHRFIREHAFDELMIDVADYKHVHHGPGIAPDAQARPRQCCSTTGDPWQEISIRSSAV